MADPLSITASAIGILTFGLTICKRISDIYGSAKDSRDDVRALCESVKTLEKTLTILQNVLRQPQLFGNAAQSARESIVRCEDALNLLEKKLSKISRLSSDSATLTVEIFVRYAFKQKTIAKLNTRVHRDLMTHLLIAMETLNLEISVSLRREIQTLSFNLGDHATFRGNVQDGLHQLQISTQSIEDVAAAERKEAERDRAIRWVAQSDTVGDFHNSACERREPRTGDWFLQGLPYRRWISESNSFLWIHGMAGCGKTILCSTIIADIASYCSVRPKHQLAYFYFSFIDPQRQKAENCLRTILRQLLLQRSTLPDGVRDIFLRYEYGRPPVAAWKIALESMLQETSPTFIIIDALDESPAVGGERAKLLELLQSLTASQRPNLHVLVTSRKESDIEAKLKDLVTLPPLSAQGEDTDIDIRTHVKAQLATDDSMSKWPESTKLEVEEALTTKAKGMFRWVSCQLDALRKCLRPIAVRQTLSTLPSTLDETYERMLLNIDEQYKKEAWLALTWLVAARRVLTVEELAEAVSIDADSEELFDPSNRLFDPNAICDVLAGLVSIGQSHEPRGSSHIRLAHFSVEEYLVSDRLLNSRASNFHVPFEMSHIKLAASSLIYLRWAKIFLKLDTGHPLWRFSDNVRPTWSSDKDQQIAVEEKVPLLAYTCEYWWLHVRLCGSHLPEREIRLVKEFLECQERMAFFENAIPSGADEGCHSSRYAIRASTPYYVSTKKLREGQNFTASPLYHAARLDLVDVVKALLRDIPRSHVSSNQCMPQKLAPGTFGDELRVACFYGHKEVVEILLDAGADPEAVGGGFETPIGACMYSTSPNPGIIQMLLDRLEKIRPDDDWIAGWVLRWAAMEGHLPVVRNLMSKTNSIQPQDYTWTLVYFQRRKFLTPIKARKDVEGSESYSKQGTAPYEAASAGHYEILSLLISNWSSIDEKDDEGRTSLYWAAFYGHTATVKLLLENGAGIYGHKDVQEWTPAYWAHIKGFHEIEELLVQADRSAPRAAQGGAESEADLPRTCQADTGRRTLRISAETLRQAMANL